MSIKRCSQCHAIKPLDDFARMQASKDGRRAYCKGCGRRYAARYYASRDRAELSAKAARWRAANREKLLIYQREYQREWQRRKRERLREAGAQ